MSGNEAGDLQKLFADVGKAAGVSFEALGTAMQAAAKAFQEFGGAYLRRAEKEYLSCHRRLPGSTRKARLRKKRQSVVRAWQQSI